MHIRTCTRIGLVALMLGLALGLSACATGYIVTAVNSVVGLDVSENPQTQVPHIRFGFCRSQYYYIPTGKSESKGGPSTGKADETPSLVSSFDLDMAFLQSTSIHEKFAVGAAAVNTPAATSLFNPQYTPISAVPGPTTASLREQIFTLAQNQTLKDKGKAWIDANHPAYKNRDFDAFVYSAPDADLQKLLEVMKAP